MIHRDKKKKCLTRRGFTCSFWHGMGVWVGAFIAFISPSLFLAQMGSKKRAKSAREDDASQHGSTTEELGAGPSQRGEWAKFPWCLAHPPTRCSCRPPSCVCVCVCVSPDVLTVMVGPRLCSQASTHAAAKGASTNKTTLRLRKWGRPTMGRRQRSNTRVSDQHAHCQARTSRCSLAVVNVLTVAVSPCWRIFTGRGRKRAKGPSAGEDGASSEDEETPKKKTRRVQREHHPSSHIHTHAVDTGACTLAP